MGSDKAPTSAPPPEAESQDDGGDLDLLDADYGESDEGDEAADISTAQPADDADRPAWQRPDGLDADALIEWKESQGLPTDAAGYEIKLDLREGEQVSEIGQHGVLRPRDKVRAISKDSAFDCDLIVKAILPGAGVVMQVDTAATPASPERKRLEAIEAQARAEQQAERQVEIEAVIGGTP